MNNRFEREQSADSGEHLKVLKNVLEMNERNNPAMQSRSSEIALAKQYLDSQQSGVAMDNKEATKTARNLLTEMIRDYKPSQGGERDLRPYSHEQVLAARKYLQQPSSM